MRSLSSKSTSASFRGLRWGGPALAYAMILRRRVVPAAATAVDVRVPAQRRLQWPRTHRRRKAAMSGLLFVALVTAAQAGAFGRTVNFGAALRLMLPGNVWLARKLVEMQTGLGLFNSCLLAREATRLDYRSCTYFGVMSRQSWSSGRIRGDRVRGAASAEFGADRGARGPCGRLPRF